MDLVLFMENVNKGGEVSLDEALAWLAENFGQARADAAYVARSEQSVLGHLEERRLEREQQTPGRSMTPEHGAPGRAVPEPDHTDYSFGR